MALIVAERMNRLAWMEAEEAGTRKKGKKAFADLMGSKVVDGQLVLEAEPKKTKTKSQTPRKPRVKKTDKGE